MLLKITKSLAELKEDAYQRIDRLAGDVCAQYVTVATAQELRYQAKRADARAYIAADYPADATVYPWVKREAEETGLTYAQKADEIEATAALWDTIGSTIESKRVGAKRLVNLAGSQAEIRTAEQDFITAMAAL
ncbi:hypothetical protein [Methylobacter sp.]